MTKRKKKDKKTWSITRIKHSKYPEFTGRVGEFQDGGMLHFFLQVNGKQTSRSLKCRRCDLGADKTAQEKEARRLAIDYIEGLATPDAVVESLGSESSPVRKVNRQLTIGALAGKYEVDGLVRVKRYKIAKAARDEQSMGDEARLIDALRELLPELERDVTIVLEATGRTAAEARLLGIRRAAGSVRSELGDDDKRILTLANELAEVNAKRTARARQYEKLQSEANGLTDRFALPALKLETLVEPPHIEVPAPWRHHMVRPSFEQCEHNLRQRRDYAEIRASAGSAIIMKAGLKPFRPLTEQEKKVLEDREDERRPDPVLAAATVEANALSNLGMPGGGIARG